MYKNILFDFDGTLFDTSIGIINAAKYVLSEYKIDYSKIDLKKIIGPPLNESFKYLCGLNDNDSLEATQKYREYYRNNGLYESTVCEGIECVLQILQEKGYNIFIASSKPELFIEKLLKNNNLFEYFKYISGSPIEGKAYSKEEVILKIINKFNLKTNETVIIGDTKYDVIGARNNNIDAIGVTYCLESCEELYECKPKYIAKDAKDILKIVCNTVEK